MDLVKFVEEQLLKAPTFPTFRVGDNVTVNYKIIEGSKERIQAFRGDVIQINGRGMTRSFAVRKMSNGVGVERVFPYASPNIESVELNKQGQVRRARLYYLRELVGKKARIKESNKRRQS